MTRIPANNIYQNNRTKRSYLLLEDLGKLLTEKGEGILINEGKGDRFLSNNIYNYGR